MNNLNFKCVAGVIYFLNIIGLSGCGSSTIIYEKEYIKNDSTFVHRDVGAEVFIGLSDGVEYTGELLSVNDSTIILSNEYGLSEEELLGSSSNISVIQNRDIKSMWVLGKDNHLIGIVIGVASGAIIGFALGDDPRPHKTFSIHWKAGAKACGLGILGGVVGLLIGAATSTYDAEIYNYKNHEELDFNQLNIYSRYGETEPVYLGEIK